MTIPPPPLPFLPYPYNYPANQRIFPANVLGYPPNYLGDTTITQPKKPPVSLGQKSKRTPIYLSSNSDFLAAGKTSDGSNFPTGAVIKIVFDDVATTEWLATISGNRFSWNIDKTQVASLIASGVTRGSVLYHDNSGTDLEWSEGPVITDD